MKGVVSFAKVHQFINRAMSSYDARHVVTRHAAYLALSAAAFVIVEYLVDDLTLFIAVAATVLAYYMQKFGEKVAGRRVLERIRKSPRLTPKLCAEYRSVACYAKLPADELEAFEQELYPNAGYALRQRRIEAKAAINDLLTTIQVDAMARTLSAIGSTTLRTLAFVVQLSAVIPPGVLLLTATGLAVPILSRLKILGPEGAVAVASSAGPVTGPVAALAISMTLALFASAHVLRKWADARELRSHQYEDRQLRAQDLEVALELEVLVAKSATISNETIQAGMRHLTPLVASLQSCDSEKSGNRDGERRDSDHAEVVVPLLKSATKLVSSN